MCSMTTAYTSAESTIHTAPIANTLSATASLGLKVVIPRFLFFQIGSRGDTVDTLAFEPSADNVGNGSIVNATGGNAAAGSSARIDPRGNAGQITITATNDDGVGGLGSGGAISQAEIRTLSVTPERATPILTDSGGDTARATVSRGNVTDRKAIWRYEYKNLHAVAPGMYRAGIIYTVASP